MSSIILEIVTIVLLLVLNGYFAMSELAIVSSRKARLAAKAADGSRGAAAAIALAENPGRFLSSVQIGITLVGILAGAYSGATLAEHLAEWLRTFPLLLDAADALAIALVVGAITYGSLIIGELVPKRIALADPEGVAVFVARPMTLVARLTLPLVWLLEASSHALMSLLRLHNSTDQSVTEEEVKALIAEGTESGLFDQNEKELMSRVMRFGDRKIRAIMTPRGDVLWIDLDWEPSKIVRTIRDSRHSRFPVYRGDPNEVQGVVQAKDLLDAFLDGKPLDLAAAVQRLEVVHDTAPAVTALNLLKRSAIHMALVVDEYGTVEGIVTASDLLSALVGTLAEHGEQYEAEAVQREDGSWLLDGDLPVDLAAEKLGLRSLDEEGDYETLAGFMLSQFGTIPKAGEHFDWRGWCFEVVDMDGRRIDKVMARKGAGGA